MSLCSKKRERERRWKTVFAWDLGQSCVLQCRVRLRAAHCTDCICLWIGWETTLPGMASHRLTVQRNMQTAVRIKILCHACTRVHTCSGHGPGHDMLRYRASQARSHFRTGDRTQASWGRLFLLRKKLPPPPSLISAPDLFPLKYHKRDTQESAAALISPLPQVSPSN